MKNNRDQLSHAFEGLRNDTLMEAVAAMEIPSEKRTPPTRRWMAVATACLSAVLLLGALVALPMLTADDPMVPPMTNEMSDKDGLFYYDAPIVKLMSLSAETAVDSEIQDIIMQMGDYERVAHEFYLLFDALEEGETLTLISHNSYIAQATMEYVRQSVNNRMNYVRNSETEQASGTSTDSVIERGELRIKEVSEYLQTITYDPSLSDGEQPVFMWDYRAMTEEARVDGNIYEDYVDFVIRDAEGNITGAGSLYLTDKKLMANEDNNRYFSIMSISRGEILGSVRFNEPASVTEEQVMTVLEEMHGGADGLASELFDETTYTSAEMYIKNWATILETHYAEYLGTEDLELVLRGGNVAEGMRHIMISTIYEPDNIRNFFFFEDGTYTEAEDIQCICPDCGEVEIVEHPFHSSKHPVVGADQQYFHRLKSIWVCYLIDGRVMEVARNADGNYVYAFVSVEGTTA